MFEQTLGAPSIRQYLQFLHDFDAIEAEEAALGFAEPYPHLGAAISFLVDRPSHDRAARIVLAWPKEVDGDSYHTFTTAAGALEAKHPLSAKLLRRAVVLDTLSGGKSKRYRHAARHLAECQSCDAAIADYTDHPTQAEFLELLNQDPGPKHGFWRLVGA